ncbi:MAG: hypothetical protein CM1200mP29_08160 [Verrucomicrobiota bacterium]|nr:MAG: hypothetical protein CM1200mP29_08160 [Verrucomicrobiota bacterium]
MFSHFWFNRVADLVPNHLLAKAENRCRKPFNLTPTKLAGVPWL